MKRIIAALAIVLTIVLMTFSLQSCFFPPPLPPPGPGGPGGHGGDPGPGGHGGGPGGPGGPPPHP